MIGLCSLKLVEMDGASVHGRWAFEAEKKEMPSGPFVGLFGLQKAQEINNPLHVYFLHFFSFLFFLSHIYS